MDNHITYTFAVVGTLAADWAIRFKMPFDAQLVHVSAGGSNDKAAGLNIGTTANTSAHMAKKSIGVSGTPLTFDYDDLATYQSQAYPRVEAGETVVVELDYDYNGGGSPSASANVTVALTFAAG